MEEMLDAFADRISKPRLCLTDKMLISLGKFLWYYIKMFFLKEDQIFLHLSFLYKLFIYRRFVFCPEFLIENGYLQISLPYFYFFKQMYTCCNWICA